MNNMRLTKPDRGWSWIVMSAVFGFACIAGYFQWAGGMTRLILIDKFHASSLETSWISAVFLSLISFAGPVASIIINKYNCRVSMITGSLILATGLILTAFVEDIKFTLFTLGIVSGTGLGICYNTGMIVLAFNFEKRRNIACGIAISGAGIGLFILTPIYQMIYETYSYTGYFLLLGGLALQNFVFGATFKDSETEYAMRKANKNRNRKLGFKESISSYMEIVRSPPMMCICICYLLADISIFLVYIHFPEYCLHTHSTKREVSMFLSLAGICSCIGRILFGMANNSHNINELIMLFGIFSMLGLGTMLFTIFSYSFQAKIIYACFLGSYSGCCWTVVNTIVIDILGHERLAHGIGYIMLYVGIGTFLGPPLAGFIIDNGGTFGDSFIVAGILFIIGAFFSLLSMMCRTDETEKELNMQNYEFDVKINEEAEMISIEYTTENHSEL